MTTCPPCGALEPPRVINGCCSSRVCALPARVECACVRVYGEKTWCLVRGAEYRLEFIYFFFFFRWIPVLKGRSLSLGDSQVCWRARTIPSSIVVVLRIYTLPTCIQYARSHMHIIIIYSCISYKYVYTRICIYINYCFCKQHPRFTYMQPRHLRNAHTLAAKTYYTHIYNIIIVIYV